MYRMASAVVLKIFSLIGCYATVVRLRLGDKSFEILLVDKLYYVIHARLLLLSR